MDFYEALKKIVELNQRQALQTLLSNLPKELTWTFKSPHLLHIAIINSAVDVIPFLLDSGADINAEFNGKYSLTQAKNSHVLELLLSRGADPNLKIRSSRYKSTLWTYPLHYILSSDFDKIEIGHRRLLKRHSLDSFLGGNKKTIEDLVLALIRHGAQVNLQDSLGQTALHFAVSERHHVGILQHLINAGGDVNRVNQNGETPLFKAIRTHNEEVVQCLIGAGADVNIVSKSTGKSVIFNATYKTTLEALLDNGADVKTIDGDSPLNCLLANRNIGTENVWRLIHAGCDVNYENTDGCTAIIHAAKYVDIELLELLVQEGADVNASGRKFPHKTALSTMFTKLWIEKNRATDCINYLLDQNANIDKVHPSVIHVLITSGSLSLIPRFISRGLDPTYLLTEQSEDSWFSPLMVALLLNQSDLAQYFIEINYLMKSDIAVLYGNRDTQILLERQSAFDSLELLNKVSQQPIPLAILCFIILSDALGCTGDRRLEVQNLGLPQQMQEVLLFKNVNEDDLIRNKGLKDVQLYKQSLKQVNVYDSDDEDYENSVNFESYDYLEDL